MKRLLLVLLFLAGTAPLGAQVKVYPNPCAGDSFQVSYTLPSSGTAEILIYNEVGDLVAKASDHWPAGPQKSVLSVYWFRRGLYLCRVVFRLDTGEVLPQPLIKFTVIH